jgi:PIN domain nuclease of toxin-antitoxin system
MEPFANNLARALAEQDYQLANLTAEISQLAGPMDRDHRDPFDRMIGHQRPSQTSIDLR